MPKFLLLRFSSIGDIVLTTPVIRCLKEQVPGAEIHYLTRKAFTPVLEHHPQIDRLITFEKEPYDILSGLKKEDYDAIIDLHHNRRSFVVKRNLKRPSFSFRKLNIEKWLMVNFKWNKLPDVHIVDRYLETVESLGVKNDGKGLDYFITPGDEHALKRLPASHQNGYIALAIGAQHATKRLPDEKLMEVCNLLKFPVVVLGGKTDVVVGEKLQAAGAHVFNGCGLFSLNESAAIIKNAGSVITHDTGLMHIAAAFKRPVISIWGNTIPEFGMTPYYGTAEIKNRRFEVAGLSCRPCSKIGHDRCPKRHFNCMNLQDTAAIAATANEWFV